jgi:hypothetical protein
MLEKLLLISTLGGRGMSFSKIYLFHVFLIPSFYKTISVENLKKFIKNQKPILFLLFYSSFSLIWTPNLMNGIQDVIYLLLGVLIIFIIISSNVSLEEFLKYLTYFFLLNLLISVIESFDVLRYPISRYSQFSHIFGIPYVGEENGRTIPTGFLVNENNNAFFILIFAPIVVNAIKSYFRIPYSLYLLDFYGLK